MKLQHRAKKMLKHNPNFKKMYYNYNKDNHLTIDVQIDDTASVTFDIFKYVRNRRSGSASYSLSEMTIKEHAKYIHDRLNFYLENPDKRMYIKVVKIYDGKYKLFIPLPVGSLSVNDDKVLLCNHYIINIYGDVVNIYFGYEPGISVAMDNFNHNGLLEEDLSTCDSCEGLVICDILLNNYGGYTELKYNDDNKDLNDFRICNTLRSNIDDNNVIRPILIEHRELLEERYSRLELTDIDKLNLLIGYNYCLKHHPAINDLGYKYPHIYRDKLIKFINKINRNGIYIHLETHEI